MKILIALTLGVIAALAFTAGTVTSQEPPFVGVEVTDEDCGIIHLLFVNESDEVVQFELRIAGDSAGVFTVAANDDGEWTEAFVEGFNDGSVIVDYRVLPDGSFIELAEVETICEEEVVPTPTPCTCPTETPIPTETPVPPTATPIIEIVEVEVPVIVDRETITVVDREVPVFVDREVPVIVGVSSGVITPPNTGSAGIK